MSSRKRLLITPRTFVLILFCVITVFANASTVAGQCVSLTGGTYTQNFDTLTNVAGSTTNVLTITGWHMDENGGGARDNNQYAVDTGASNTGDTYSYGAAGSTERALGSIRSGTVYSTYGVCFTNNTGSPITSLTVGYTGEMWRVGTVGRTDQLNFEYSLDASSLATGTWSSVASLNFYTILSSALTTGAKDGNAPENRYALSSSIGSQSIADGATFWLRWVDTDASSVDDALAIDDFSLAPIYTTTAAGVQISGRVTDRRGRGIRGARVSVTGSDGRTRTASTGSFGRYAIDGLRAGDTYVVAISARRFIFSRGLEVLYVSDSLSDLDFTSDN